MKLKKTEKPIKQIDRGYLISSAELREKLGIEGTIQSIGLWKGRSTNEEEEGVSPEIDEWYIKTVEVKSIR